MHTHLPMMYFKLFAPLLSPDCQRTAGRGSLCHQLFFYLLHRKGVVVTGHKSSWLPTPKKIREPHILF